MYRLEKFEFVKKLNSFRFNSLFNLTMTYRRDSDIYTPFGKIEKLTEQSKWKPLKNDTRKLAAWIVSHCETDSGREKYVEVILY